MCLKQNSISKWKTVLRISMSKSCLIFLFIYYFCLMVWKVMELCCDLMETIYPAINAQVLDPDATECVCVHVWQTERAWQYFWTTAPIALNTHTHTHTTGWRVCSHCPVVMGLLSTAETLSHTFSWEIDFPEVPIPFVCALCVSVSESECVYVWESPTIKIILTIIVS